MQRKLPGATNETHETVPLIRGEGRRTERNDILMWLLETRVPAVARDMRFALDSRSRKVS